MDVIIAKMQELFAEVCMCILCACMHNNNSLLCVYVYLLVVA